MRARVRRWWRRVVTQLQWRTRSQLPTDWELWERELWFARQTAAGWPEDAA